MGRVKRAHIIFSHDDWGAAGGQDIRHRGAAATPLAPPMAMCNTAIVAYIKKTRVATIADITRCFTVCYQLAQCFSTISTFLSGHR